MNSEEKLSKNTKNIHKLRTAASQFGAVLENRFLVVYGRPI